MISLSSDPRFARDVDPQVMKPFSIRGRMLL